MEDYHQNPGQMLKVELEYQVDSEQQVDSK